jgi:hypothetical protein
MPAMNNRAIWAVAAVRKPPKNEPAGDGARKAQRAQLWGFGCRGRWMRRIAMRSRASNDALGGKQKQVLMVEVASSMAIAGLLRRWYVAFE